MTTYQPTEAEWNAYGKVFATSRFGSRVVSAALWGIQAFMAADGFSAYLKIPKEGRKGHLHFVTFSCILLAVSSTSLVLDIWVVFNNLFKAGPNGRSYIEVFRQDSENNALMRRVLIVCGAMGDLTVVAGDILLLWRCFMMWSNRQWVTILPLFACAGSIVSRIAGWIIVRSKRYLLAGALVEVSMVAESLSVSMNVMVTGLILFRLWRAWLAMSSMSRPEATSHILECHGNPHRICCSPHHLWHLLYRYSRNRLLSQAENTVPERSSQCIYRGILVIVLLLQRAISPNDHL
ncbi:hypothetical protein BKA70DRAFT_1267208 [Coprinopsis sp. MPI-PUGE-AT-0042]|nr:hypothetical protein BKA70DRAFT_1267208 [Coprinopsis sp. MPI-PUGE-AT-0042]